MLEVRDLHVAFKGQPVLRGVSLQAASGSVVCVIGANGAGKTTLLRTISGVYTAQSGSISLAGNPITGLAPHRIVRLGLGHIPEGRHLFLNMTVEENLRVGAQTRPAADYGTNLEISLNYFPPIRSKLKMLAGALSGGEQQMVCVARGLMSRPRIMLLDEPSLGLAPLVVAQIFELITAIGASGTTIVLVEQNARAALAVSHYGYVLDAGRVAIEDDAQSLSRDPRVEAAYLGGTVHARH